MARWRSGSLHRLLALNVSHPQLRSPFHQAFQSDFQTRRDHTMVCILTFPRGDCLEV